jgi:hypothetical protein
MTVVLYFEGWLIQFKVTSVYISFTILLVQWKKTTIVQNTFQGLQESLRQSSELIECFWTE